MLLLVKLKALKVTFLHGCFSHFLNCTNGTKSHNASHLVNLQEISMVRILTPVTKNLKRYIFLICYSVSNKNIFLITFISFASTANTLKHAIRYCCLSYKNWVLLFPVRFYPFSSNSFSRKLWIVLHPVRCFIQ